MQREQRRAARRGEPAGGPLPALRVRARGARRDRRARRQPARAARLGARHPRGARARLEVTQTGISIAV